MTAPVLPRVVGARGKRMSAVCQHAECGKTFKYYPCQKKGDFCSMVCRRASGWKVPTYVRTEETKAKSSASIKAAFAANGDGVIRRTEAMRGKTRSAEQNKKTSDGLKSFYRSMTDEKRIGLSKRNSDRISKAWSDGKLDDRKLAIRPRASKQELSLAPLLEPLGYKSTFGHPYYIKCEDKTRVPDYVNVFEKKVLEYFGTFWHPDPLEDTLVRRMYEKAGWECIVIWESDLESFRDLLGGSR